MRHLPGIYQLLFFGCFSTLCFGQSQSNDPSIISPDTKPELIRNGFANLEGSSVSPDGTIFFVDLIHTRIDPLGAAKIRTYDPGSGEFSIYTSPSGRTLGTEFDVSGNLICAEFTDGGGRRITRRNIKTKDASFLATGYDGKPFNGPNDLTIDEKNRIYFTDYLYTIGAEALYHRFGGVYRIDSAGLVSRIIDNAGVPNGIVVSPDQKTLYVGTNGYDIWGNSGLLAYDLSEEGTATFRSILVDFKTNALIDGLTVDVDGNIYVTVVRGTDGPGVRVYAPEGKQLAFIKTPTAVQNVTFGKGDYIKTLFMVGGDSMYRIALEKAGYHLPQRK